MVGKLPEIIEKESNDTPTTAQTIDDGDSCLINGRLKENNDTDSYSMHVDAGRTLVASLVGNTILGSPMDSVLQIVSPEGFVLAQNHDDRGLDPQIVHEIPKTGRYQVRVFAFPSTPNSSIRFAGAAQYVYRLTMTTSFEKLWHDI